MNEVTINERLQTLGYLRDAFTGSPEGETYDQPIKDLAAMVEPAPAGTKVVRYFAADGSIIGSDYIPADRDGFALQDVPIETVRIRFYDEGNWPVASRSRRGF